MSSSPAYAAGAAQASSCHAISTSPKKAHQRQKEEGTCRWLTQGVQSGGEPFNNKQTGLINQLFVELFFTHHFSLNVAPTWRVQGAGHKPPVMFLAWATFDQPNQRATSEGAEFRPNKPGGGD